MLIARSRETNNGQREIPTVHLRINVAMGRGGSAGADIEEEGEGRAEEEQEAQREAVESSRTAR